mgnify:FL=1
MNRELQKHFKLLIFISIFFIPITSLADLTATIDRSVIDSNETFRLNIRYDGQVFSGEPDLTELKKDFEVLSNNRQQSYSSINGKTESFTVWVLQLKPKRSGILEIPTLNFKGDTSERLELRVRAAPKNSSLNPGSQPIYSETLLDHTEVYVNQQVILTQRLYTSINLRDFSLSELKVENAIVHRLGDTTYQKVLNGRSYLVLEVTYAIFPKGVGFVDIPRLRFGAYEVDTSRQFGIFNNRGNQVIRDTESKQIKVLSKPSRRTDRGWMPSKSVEVKQRWSGDLNKVTIGEPITQTITIIAEGLTPEQITPLKFTESTKYRTYPDQPQLSQSLSNSGIISQRVESRAIVPSESGKIILPAINLKWWDIETQKEQTAELPSLTLDVLPAYETYEDSPQISMFNTNNLAPNLTIAGENQNPSKQTHSSPLVITSLILNSILIIIVLIMFQQRRALNSTNKPSLPSSSESTDKLLKVKFKKIKESAHTRDLKSMREGILTWGKILFSDDSCDTLKKLALKLDDLDILNQFKELDRELFRNGDNKVSSLDCDYLIERLAEQGKLRQENHALENNYHELKNLYPT